MVNKSKFTLKSFDSVSEWVSLGSMGTGFYACCVKVDRETEKAIGFKGLVFNSYGNKVVGTWWFPKSKVKQIKNDYWDKVDGLVYLIPEWLYISKLENGCDELL